MSQYNVGVSKKILLLSSLRGYSQSGCEYIAITFFNVSVKVVKFANKNI